MNNTLFEKWKAVRAKNEQAAFTNALQDCEKRLLEGNADFYVGHLSESVIQRLVTNFNAMGFIVIYRPATSRLNFTEKKE